MSAQNPRSTLGRLHPGLFGNTNLKDYQGEFIKPNVLEVYTPNNGETDMLTFRKSMFLNVIEVMGQLGKIFTNPQMAPWEVVIISQKGPAKEPILSIQTHWGGKVHGYVVGVWDVKWGGMYMEGAGSSFSQAISVPSEAEAKMLPEEYSTNHESGIKVVSLIYGCLPPKVSYLKFAEAYSFYIAECARFNVLKYFFFKWNSLGDIDITSPIMLFRGDLTFGGEFLLFTPRFLASHNSQLIRLDYQVSAADLFNAIWQSDKVKEVKRYITQNNSQTRRLDPDDTTAFQENKFVFDVKKEIVFNVKDMPHIKQGIIYRE